MIRPKFDRLNLGCGVRKIEEWVNLDYNRMYKPDVVWNLNKLPLPFPKNSFVEIKCNHIIEHLDDILKFMKELYRIGKNGCIIQIRYPHFSHRSAFADPTHKHYLSHASLQYFENNHLEEPEALTHDVNFETIFKKVRTGGGLFVDWIANMNPDFWERMGFKIEEVELWFKVIKNEDE